VLKTTDGNVSDSGRDRRTGISRGNADETGVLTKRPLLEEWARVLASPSRLIRKHPLFYFWRWLFFRLFPYFK
jgi:hypothetical protein